MIVAEYFIRFIFFSFLGWVYECIYCTIKSGRWENRGFLIGPICPIYGFGATGAWIIFTELHIFSNGMIGTQQPVWKIFIICALGSAVLEYSISLLLEKVFNAKWWDYSETPLNINGRICVPATCGFGVAGIVIVRYFFPWLDRYDNIVLYHPLVNEAVALAFMMILGMDIALTEASLTSLLAILDEVQEKFDERMEAGVITVTSMPGMMKEKAAAGMESITSIPAKIMGLSIKVPRLSWRQNYHLNSIQKFVKPQHVSRVSQLKTAASRLKEQTVDRIGKMRDDDDAD